MTPGLNLTDVRTKSFVTMLKPHAVTGGLELVMTQEDYACKSIHPRFC